MIPAAGQLRGRLSSGERREAAYGYWKPGHHVRGEDMADKLAARATDAAGLRCYLCGREVGGVDLHLDHVRPLAARGKHVLWNLEPACATCNLVKSDAVLPWEPPVDDFRPLHERLLAMPVEDLWVDADPARRRLVNSFIRAPRPVPIDRTRWTLPKVRVIVGRLLAQPDPYRAIPLRDLSTTGGGDLNTNYWSPMMGTSITKNNATATRRVPHNRRCPPHPLLVPTRFVERRGTWGTKAFRLRFRVPPATAARWLEDEDLEPVFATPLDQRFPDQDEVDLLPQPFVGDAAPVDDGGHQFR